MNVLDLPPHTPTRLITLPRDSRVATNSRSTDSTTSLTRGVAEYVSSLSTNVPGGRQLQFIKCFDAWPQPEDLAEYPSFAAYTNDNDGEYDAANVSPHVGDARYPDGSYEVSSAELNIDLNCEVWATDPEERQALVLMLEEAFAPVEWMYGFRLELPHYFNQRATFAPMKTKYLGGSVEAMQQFVNARIVLRASVPVTRVIGFPIAKPSTVVKVSSAILVPPKGSIVDGGTNS